jgi:hypothetical protein
VAVVTGLSGLAWATALGVTVVAPALNPALEVTPGGKYSTGINARKWVDELRRTWPAEPVNWVDQRYTRGFLVSPLDGWYPHNLASALVGPLQPGMTWTTDPAGAYFVAETGQVTPVTITRQNNYSLDTCLDPTTPLTLPYSPATDFLIVDYQADQAAELVVTVELATGTSEDADGLPGNPAITAGEHSTLVLLRHPEQTTAVTLAATAPVCLTQLASAEFGPG